MPPSTASSPRSRLESSAFYVIIITLVLAPLAFWPSQYVALDAVKTFVIAIGVLVSAVLYGAVALKEKRLILPPRSMTWVGILMALSLIASAIGSGHVWKSIFGQGFEIDSASFIILLLLSAAVFAAAAYRRTERAVVIYAAIVGPYILLWIFQALRFILGAKFLTLGILGALSTSVFGNWYSLAIYSAVVIILGICALMFLPLSPRVRFSYWLLVIVAAVGAFVINFYSVWQALSLVFLGLSIYATSIRPRTDSAGPASFFRRLAWIPVIAFLVAALFVWKGNSMAGPVVSKLSAGYSELSLPWQMTLDVGTSVYKADPLLGAGPDRFGQAFLAHKPSGINQSDAWSVEFNTGFGLIPTLMVEQGMIGLILWVLLFVYLGLAGNKALARAAKDSDPSARFIVVSSFSAAVLVWIVSLVYVPSSTAFFLAFAMTGIMLGASAAYGYLPVFVLPRGADIATSDAPSSPRLFPAAVAVLTLVAIVWGLVFIKNTAALAYFGSGLSQLTVSNDPAAADADFRTAVTMNPIDVYWQARAEANLAMAQAVASKIASSTDASTTQALTAETVALGDQAFQYASRAIAADPTNYYNYLSEARAAEFAVSLQMKDAYQTGEQAYASAIGLNPGNPSLYLDLARLQVSQKDLDPAIQTIGASLQVKSNYLDAVYLLSQVEASKGNLPDAITAAQFAVNLNPTSPLLYFQLGILQYTHADYGLATTTLTEAVKLQPDYANAQYFLGLSFARIGNIPAAVDQFRQLSTAYPDNQQIALILADLKAGKSLFESPTAPAATTAASKTISRLPIAEKKP